MKKNRKRMCLVLGAVSAFLLVAMMRTGEAVAYSVMESKALGYSVYRCYTGMYDGSAIMPRSLNLRDIVNINSIINPSAPDFAAVPSGVESLQANPPADYMSCLELFAGSSSNPSAPFRGLLRGVGIDIWTSEGDKSALLKKMGYQAEEATGDGTCVSFNMMKREKDGTMPTIKTPQVCSKDGTLAGINEETLSSLGKTSSKSRPVVFYMSGGYLIADMFGSGPACENDCYRYDYSKSASYAYKLSSSAQAVIGFGPNWAAIAYNASNLSFESLMNVIKDDIAKHFSSGDPYAYTLRVSNPMNTVPYAVGMGETEYALQSDGAGAALTVMNDLLGTSYEKIEDLSFTPGEQYDLYNYYLRNVYGINEGNAICDGFGSGQPTEDDLAATGWKKMLFKSGSSFKSCYVYPQNGTEGKLVYGLSPEGAYFNGTKRRWGELVDAVNNLFNTNQLSADAVGGTVDSGTPEDDRICYDQSVGGLGWLVCSILPTVTGVGKSMWDFAEENMEFPARGVFGADSGVERAWGVIRNIANMVFIVLFLLVIFSQLTGYGIDNYGIKRILPKMVVTAILINFSLPICRLVIDISNTVGVGINAILSNNLAKSVVDASGVEGASQAWRIGSLFGAGSISAIVAALFRFLSGPLGLLSAAGSLGLAALGFMITTVFSIFFLYLILVARQAGIILCVVLAPVAIACGMLPNTEKTYKRWIDIFKAMLVLYPICGAMVGAGQLAGAVLASVPSEGARLAAMIVQVVPYFMVPSMTKNSLSGIGNLGVKLSNVGKSWGNKVSGAARGGIKSSEPVKSAREWANMVDTRRKAGLDVTGKAMKLGAIGTFLRGGKRGIAKSRSQYLRDLDTETRADVLMDVGYEAARIGQKKRAEKDLTADYVTLINDRTRSGEDETSLYGLYNKYIEEGNSYGAVAVARIAGRRKDTAAGFLSAIETGKFKYMDKEGKEQEMDVSKTANTKMKILSSVMKEIATGDNSGMYRASAPVGFEFAAQFNRNYSEDASGNFNGTSESSYNTWLDGGKTDEHGNWTGNVDRAIDNYITGVRELQGLKGSSLRELAKLIENKTIGQKQRDMIRRLAINAVEKRDEVGSGWDPTKADALVALTGGAYKYNKDSGDIEKLQPAA